MTMRQRFIEVLKLAPNHMGPELAAQFRAMLTPTSLAMIAGTFAALAVSQAFGVGEIVDVILLLVGVIFVGMAVFTAAKDIFECVKTTAGAKTTADLDRAADYLAQAVAILGVVAFFALIAKIGEKFGGAASAEEEGNAAAANSEESAPKSKAKEQPKSREKATPSLEELIAQRKAVAQDFYRSQGWPQERIAAHMKGIDFTKPVEVVPLDPGTVLTQYQNPGAPQGDYYALPGTDPATLGIDAAGRVPANYVVSGDAPVQALRSTASDVLDWKGSGTTFKGGATQFFTPDSASITPLQ